MAKKKQNDFDFIRAYKVIDPIIQSILIINFFILYDARGHKEHGGMLMMVLFQFLSQFIHLFLKYSKKLKIERYISFASIILFFYLNKTISAYIGEDKIHEKQIEVFISRGRAQIPVYDTLLMITGMAISIWYFTICIREIQYLMKKRRRG